MRLRRAGGRSVGRPRSVEHEALVLGGGPAGCAAAIVLARRGHEVALVRPAAPPAGALAESVPPSARKLLAELGILAAVERAGFLQNDGNTSWWAARPVRIERFGEGETGFQVDRQALEAVLVEAARAVGVTVYEGASARSARRVVSAGRTEADEAAVGLAADEADAADAATEAIEPTEATEATAGLAADEATLAAAGLGEAPRSAAWTVQCAARSAGDRLSLRAAWLIDATGRHGLLARRLRRPDRRTSTVAVVRRWRRPGGWPVEEPSHTLLETYRDGWAWSVPLAGGERCFTAMIDAGGGRDAGPRGANDLFAAELSKTVHLRALLEGAEPVGDAWACPASLYDARAYAQDGLALAGDAGSFIDPLSSYGVKKALSSGWLAGVAVHTALVDAGMRTAALGFFDAREREVYRRYRAASVVHFEEAAAAYGHPYWTERAEAARTAGAGPATRGGASGTVGVRSTDAAPVGPGREADGRVVYGSGVPATDLDGLGPPVPPETEVRAAFEVIRARSALDAALAATARVVQRPSVEAERIVMAPHVASDLCPAGLRYVRGVDLASLVDVAPRHAQVPDVWAAYNGVAPPVSLPDFLVALSTAFAAGLLVHRD